MPEDLPEPQPGSADPGKLGLGTQTSGKNPHDLPLYRSGPYDPSDSREIKFLLHNPQEFPSNFPDEIFQHVLFSSALACPPII